MMRMRGDFICLHEPFGPAYYRGADRRTTRPQENPLEPGRTYASTWTEILEVAGRGRIFSKDMATHVMHMVDGSFLDHFQHTFLIRDPAQSLASMYEQWQAFSVEEAGFEDLHRMFDIVVERYDEIPPLIDADDLLDDPAGTVKAYRRAVDIEYMPEALEWKPGDRSDVRWYGGTWHDRLATSSGLGRQATMYVDVGEVPFLAEMYQECRPHYEALLAHKLEPVSA